MQPLVYVPAVVKSEWEQFPLRLDYGRSPHVYVNQRLQIQLELLMTSGVPLETCSAINERWNNKFCYKVASCWLFLLNFHYVTVVSKMFCYLYNYVHINISLLIMIYSLKSPSQGPSYVCNNSRIIITSSSEFLPLSLDH